MAQLINKAEAIGTYQGIPVDKNTELIVELTALDITKTADKMIWVDGELTYTIVVTNIDKTTPGTPVLTVEVTDIIDPTIAKLVANSVTIDGNPAIEPTDYTYEPTTGLLTVKLGEILAGRFRTITFRVEEV